MKKNLITLLLILSVVVSFAQTNTDSSKHLSFKGVPLDGTLNQYVAKMKQAGFKHIRTDDGIAILTGDFAGYKDCFVGVSTLKQKDLVHKIGIVFSDRDTWSALSGNYFDLKQMLTEKYGTPSHVEEKFDRYSEPRNDATKMYEVQFDRCKYQSVWETDKGEIQLSIDHKSVSSCFVKLIYFDKINGATIKKQALDDL
ncbi:hypothetical protein JMG10_19900 [Nostoc ellipsosporum NOK]|nr:hypothetical protein [Nostoc ellipsosporum NOK]